MPDPVVEQIKQRIDIIEFLSEYLKLQKAGSNWRAVCPFHNEKSPSFMVSQDKQIWHCFGCSKGGDIFTFLQEMEGIEFTEALRQLAQRANVTLVHVSASQQAKKQRLLEIVLATQQFYAQTLHTAPEGKIARDYVAKRQINDDSLKQFGLGYSFDDWAKLRDYLLQRNYTEAEQVAAGVLIHQPGGSFYDRFRGRLMVPLHDVNGTVVGFTARTLKAEETGGKYINSPQSEIYDKSQLLYGLFKAKQSIKKLNATIVVEGNLDVVTAHQHGFPNTVATSGTAFTAMQLTQLKRYSLNLLLAFDLDAAGQQAADRGIDLALQQNMNIKVVRWPEQYKDPDECIRANPEAFKEAIRNAISIVDYWFMQASKNLQLSTVDGKKSLVQRLLPKLVKLTDPVEVSHYVQRLAELVNVDASLLHEQLKKLKMGKGNTPRITKPAASNLPAPKPKVRDRSTRLAEHVLGLLLLIPEQFGYANDYFDTAFISDPELGELYRRMLDQYNKAGLFSEEDYLQHYPEDAHLLGKLRLQVDNDFSNATAAEYAEALIRGIRDLQAQYIRQRLKDIAVELNTAALEQNQTLAEQLSDEANLLTQQLTELSS